MSKTALLIIDVQQGFNEPYWGERNNPDAEKNMVTLLDYWRMHKWPVVHVQHCSKEFGSPLTPGQPGCEFKPEVQPIPGEMIFQKSVNSAFIGTSLENWLREEDINQLVVVGLTTEHCVSTTVRMAGNLGFRVRLASDATASFECEDRHGNYHSAESIHNVHLASLDGEFCKVQSTSEILTDNA